MTMVMFTKNREVKGLHQLFLDQIRDLYNVEHQQIRAFPRFAEAALHPEYRTIVNKHFEQTKNHILRLEKIFENLGENPTDRECAAVKALIQKSHDIAEKNYGPRALEAALIAAVQYIEHYEIAGYGAVRSFARQLGDDESANLLQQTLNEEAHMDRLLSELAEYEVNSRAAEVSTRLFHA
ncbi:MAG TPA: ferritin-like domain-containing protein [Phycisphaerae bacterium]|nr:ferritin-like domain-containing protein [Phycisphaerae bacterium]